MAIGERGSVTLRAAGPEDLMFYFTLRNEAGVRANSRNTNPIDLETHRRWFTGKLQDPNTRLMVIILSGEAIGQVRIDVREDRSEISIAIIPECRGKGYGAWAIREACRMVFSRVPKLACIFAYIRAVNSASRRSFATAGFFECGPVSYRGAAGWIEAVLTKSAIR